jgi:hypothetical protein
LSAPLPLPLHHLSTHLPPPRAHLLPPHPLFCVIQLSLDLPPSFFLSHLHHTPP